MANDDRKEWLTKKISDLMSSIDNLKVKITIYEISKEKAPLFLTNQLDSKKSELKRCKDLLKTL